MLLKRKCECGWIASAQRKQLLLEHIKEHQQYYQDAQDKHEPARAKDV